LRADHDICTSAWLKYGLELPRCADGKIRQTVHVEASGLRRGAKATVTIGGAARYTVHDADSAETAAFGVFDSVVLTLVDAKHASTPIVVDDWSTSKTSTTATFKVPEVPDGDYKLHVVYATHLDHGELDVPVPFYTPARIHVITDRPLYEPGNLVRFRAVVLRARDLAPVDGRPGMWVVRDPANEVLLEEQASAGDWGVVSGTFPLDKASPTGTWHVAWRSADASDDVAFTVEPFTLPRFRVDASTAKPFYQPGDTPVVRGAVIYSSGAPVANAKLDLAWDIAGDWPPPLDWQAKLLPKQSVTAANGRFELTLPQIPTDLQGQATMTARISAVDAAGDRVEGSTTVLLSKDGIQAAAVTELGNGLVQGFNNRLYIRVASADGRVLSNTKINVKRAWQANDNGIDADLDEDGVAALQIDPGAPVNIVIPALPWRPAPKQPEVTRTEAAELIAGEGAPLVDQEAMDKWLAALVPCAKWVDDSDQGARVGLRVDTGGAIVAAGAGPSPLERCVVNLLRQRSLPPGAERMYTVTFNFGDADLPKLVASVESALDTPAGLPEKLQELARGARDCLPVTADGELPSMLTWRAKAESKDVELGGWIKDPKASETAAALGCVTARVAGQVHLEAAATEDSLGVVRFTVQAPEQAGQSARPQPTTMLGYELLVTADGETKPTTKLRVEPGQIPPLRMRVTPVLAKPGDKIAAALIRGPTFSGELPKELQLDCLKSHDKAKLDADHKAELAIPAGTEGWCEITGGGQRALVYIRPQAELAVTVKTKDRYAPGDKAELRIQTTIGGKGGKAAVGLFGVDESLRQLVPLPGPGDLARLQPKVETTTPAFGVLDGQALTLGRIRGANAAAATVLRVSSIPTPPELDALVSADGETRFDPVEELTDHFYVVLAELHAQARAWEDKAPPAEKMRPATMAELWKKALAACEKRGERVDDAYGRRLRLSRLPDDLLALTDPRAVIVVGTRLPEDVENWSAWVAKERP
jgi:hypothetical protein